MMTLSRENYDSEGVRSEMEWDYWSRKKAFAVGVMAIVWAGGELPPQMIREARKIKKTMLRNGTWKPA